MHFAGTLIGVTLALFAPVTRRPRMVLALPSCGYRFAWPAHWFIEKNNPASFGHPLWSLRGDFEMIKYMLQGRDAELTEGTPTYCAHTTPTAGARPRCGSRPRRRSQIAALAPDTAATIPWRQT